MIIKTVGRSQDNNIVINDARVSRTHMQFVRDDHGNISVVDLGSANGTFVNGSRITSETRLKPGDELRIGSTVLNWQGYFPAQPQSPVAAAAQTPRPQVSSPRPQSQTKPSGRKIWPFVVAGVAVVLVIAGVIVFLTLGKNKPSGSEQALQVTVNTETPVQDRDLQIASAERDAARASEAASKARANSASHQAATAQQQAKSSELQAAEAQQQAAAALQRAKNAEEQAAAAKKSEEETRRKAEEARTRAAEKAAQDAKDAENAKKLADATEKTKLTSEFYSELNKLKDKKVDDVCKVLQIDTKKYGRDKDKKRDAIVRKFENAPTNAQRQHIIDVIRMVK